MVDKITDSNLEEFKKLIRKATFLESSEEVYFEAIPNSKWKSLFEKNFGGNWNYAQRVILNKFSEIEEKDTARVDREKFKIHNLDKATDKIIKAIDEKVDILFITDFDNDGSLAQSIINEYLKIDKTGAEHMQVHYAQTVNGNSSRGFTVDLVDRIIEQRGMNPDKKFLIITADNGINSREEQLKIQAKYPEAHIVVTDHHNPDDDMVILENDKVVIFNPHYKPTPFYERFNISGATTTGVLLRNVLKQRYTTEQLAQSQNSLDNIAKLSKVANLLDYVDTDPADKPEKDYIISKFLKLQPLLNINNSISKIITGEVSTETIKSIQEKIPNLDVDLIYGEAKNIHIQNRMARILLKIYEENKVTDVEIAKPVMPVTVTTDTPATLVESLAPKALKNEDYLNMLILKEINEPSNYIEENIINPNYIEQLRPLIFGLSADDAKNSFMDCLNNHMIAVFENIKTSEKKMSVELRRGEVITKSKLENSVIAYTDKNILTVFNRKFLNKVYNDENRGFALTLDSLDKGKVSGSFRSLYNISDILKDKAKLEKSLKVKIETPGHEKAAGFIIKSLNPEKNPITSDVIEAVNVFINNSISKIKDLEVASENTYLLTDLGAIKLLDRINRVVRGNVSNFDKISPLLKLTKDTIFTDTYSTQQYSMEDIIKDRKYGYITININFHGDTVIIPVELIRTIVENDYKDYMSLGYMDGGVFMAEKVIKNKEAKNIIDLRDKDSKTNAIAAVFEKDFKDKNHIDLNRDQIQDNPFFKYHDYGRLNFDLFERMVIGIIDSNNIDMLTVFDVEANGFGNSKLMNLGAMNYTINEQSGIVVDGAEFNNRLFATQRGDEYLLTTEQVEQLQEIPLDEVSALAPSIKKLLLVKASSDNIDPEDEFPAQTPGMSNHYYYHPSMDTVANNKKMKELPFSVIKNYLYDTTNDTVTYNREIKATMLAYLVKDDDFKVPQEMTNLTGITQTLLNKYGTQTSVVDQEFADYYKGKNVLFGAHNTPYDARVLRANTPKFYEVLKANQIYDSALFSREKKLTYDEVQVSNFENVAGLPKGVYFFNNAFSDFNLSKFIEADKNGYYPDRTGNYLLSIEDGKYFLVDKESHEIVKLEVTKEDLLINMKTGDIPNVAIKYSVEKLSEQWMIHALLLSDEKFEIKRVDLNDEKYALLKPYHDQLVFFQDNYHFDSSPEKNFQNLCDYYSKLNMSLSNIGDGQKEGEDILNDFFNDFLEANKIIQQKFSDAWMYKKVLEIKEPEGTEDITNDLVDLVQFQTALPRDKVVTIFKEALAFKKKYKIDHVLQHEGHINGPWEGDAKGDIAFEDKLTLSLLAQRNYDPYNHNVKKAVCEFNYYALRAREAFEKTDKLSNDIAQDSYSFRQGLLYNRDTKTDMIKKIQTKEYNNLFSEEEEVIIFKLNNDVLQQDTNVCAIVKKGISIDREQLESDSEKLSFIVVNEQLKYSLKNNTSGAKEYAQELLLKNDSLSLIYKKDLSTRYRYVEHNKKVSQVKKFLDTMITITEKGVYKETKTTRDMPIHDIGTDGFNTIKSIFVKYVETANRNNDTSLKEHGVSAALEFLDMKKKDYKPTALESALQNTELNFAVKSDNVNEDSFLKKVEISRQNPVKNLLNSHKDLRLLNEFIDYNTNMMKEDIKPQLSVEEVVKPVKKMKKSMS